MVASGGVAKSGCLNNGDVGGEKGTRSKMTVSSNISSMTLSMPCVSYTTLVAEL